jgi:hypothetical protein
MHCGDRDDRQSPSGSDLRRRGDQRNHVEDNGDHGVVPESSSLDTFADKVVHGARRERPKRSFERHEQLSMGTPRPSVLKILKYRVTNRGHQRVILEPPLLGPFDPDDLSCPIEVLEAQPAHFAAAQAINCKQHQDGAVAYVTCILMLRCLALSLAGRQSALLWPPLKFASQSPDPVWSK